MTLFSIMSCADYSLEALQHAIASATTIIIPLSAAMDQTVPSTSIQMRELNTQFGNFSNQLGNAVTGGLGRVMNDTATFISYAAGGVFSGSTTLPLPAATEALQLALSTYVTSLSLQQNDWAAQYIDSSSVVPGDRSNVAQTSKESAAVWKSPDTGRSYLLEQLKPTAGINDSSVLQQIDTNEWANLEVLFDGAYNCTATGRPLHVFILLPPSVLILIVCLYSLD